MRVAANRLPPLAALTLILIGNRCFAADVQAPARAPTANELRQRLRQPVDIEGFEPDTPLRDALTFLSEHFGMTISIDVQAFKDDLQINEPEKIPTRLPKLVHVPLRWALERVAEQAQGTVIQVGSLLWVVPPARARQRLLSQAVDLNLDKVPLRDALQEVANQTAFPIMLDANRGGEMAKAPVTAVLYGVRLEDAVRSLADTAGMKAIMLGDVLYVTMPDHAAELEAKEELRRQKIKGAPAAAAASGSDKKAAVAGTTGK